LGNAWLQNPRCGVNGAGRFLFMWQIMEIVADEARKESEKAFSKLK
jgi:hypothetical protein